MFCAAHFDPVRDKNYFLIWTSLFSKARGYYRMLLLNYFLFKKHKKWVLRSKLK